MVPKCITQPKNKTAKTPADPELKPARLTEEIWQTDEVLRQTRQMFTTLFKSLPNIAIVLSRNLKIKMVNRPHFKERRQCYEILFNRTERCEVCEGLKVIEEKKEIVTEKKIGSEYYQVHCYPIFDDLGEVESVLEICKPISHDNDMEQQLRQADKLASIGQLVSGIVHEINNPNMFILGNLTVVQEALKDILPVLDQYAAKNPEFIVARLKYDFFKEQITIMLQDMIDGANRIKFIVRELKRFARKDDERLIDEVDLNCVVSECLRLAENPLRRSVNIHTQLAEDLPEITGNQQKLVQVVLNMLINAAQAVENDVGIISQKGNVSVTTRHQNDKHQVILEIADDGCGMDEFTQQQIFNPFFTTKRNSGGTGLGLSISSRIIQEHGGHIDLKSEEGKGSTFTITLPPRNNYEG